jgi:hypothetical protein
MNYIVLGIAFILLIVVAQQLSLYKNKKYTNKKEKTTGQTDKQTDFMNMCFLIWMLFMIVVIVTVL